MLSVGLKAYLILVTLAGPWYCCCTLGHLADWFARPGQEEESQPVNRCCCGHHSEHRDNARSEAPVKQPKNQDEGPSCPCHEQRSLSPALLVQAPEVTKVSEGQDVLVGFADIPSHLIVADILLEVATTWPGCSSLPFLPSQDLLRAHHNLRC
jgi:hypothetical protein